MSETRRDEAIPRTTRRRSRRPARGSADELLDAGAHSDLDAMRHSTAHVMAEAVLDLFPGTKLGIGPAIDDGFYYDFELPRPLTPDDLAAIEARMADSVAADHPFVRRELPPAEGRAFFAERGQPFKVEILDDLAARRPPPASRCRRSRSTSTARSATCARARTSRPPGKIGPFKLLSVAGAYWRGDEKRPMLQRIYGTVWATQEDLDQYLWRRDEAKKRDHRRLGVQLDLFSFHDVSPGSAFWHPKGQRIWRTLESAMRELQDRRGYQEISTPILVHKKLWQQSGHWALYADNMFKLEAEGQTFSLKPMNCPESTFIYRSPPALVPRPAAALQRVRPAASQRALGHAVGPHPRPPVHPGRRPHLRPAGPAGRRDRGAARRGPRGLRLVRASSRASRSRPSPTRRSATRRCGRRPRR